MAIEKNSSKEKISREMPQKMTSGRMPMKMTTGKMPECPQCSPPKKKSG